MTSRSNVAFKFNLLHYAMALGVPAGCWGCGAGPATSEAGGWRQGLTLVHLSAQRKRFCWDKGYFGGV